MYCKGTCCKFCTSKKHQLHSTIRRTVSLWASPQSVSEIMKCRLLSVSTRRKLLGGQRGHHARLERKIPEYIQGESEQRLSVTTVCQLHLRARKKNKSCDALWQLACWSVNLFPKLMLCVSWRQFMSSIPILLCTRQFSLCIMYDLVLEELYWQLSGWSYLTPPTSHTPLTLTQKLNADFRSFLTFVKV